MPPGRWRASTVAERALAGPPVRRASLIADRPWLTVFRVPLYAHELNPVEPVWAHLKRSLAT